MIKPTRMTGAASLAIATAMLAGGLAAPAQAQDEESNDVITVTGSLIERDGNLVEASPVTTVDAAEFDVRGTLRVEDMINTLPQAFGAQGSNLANGSTGTASVDLRGLGSSRTLVLLNGRRLPYGSINIYAPDVNFIPSALIEQVDILTGGASATYGADAVAGVVNFQLMQDFEGFRIDGNYSAYQHNNDNESLQGLLSEFQAQNPTQFRVPDGSTYEGESTDITAIFGGQMDNGKGGFTGYVGYQRTYPILQNSYDYSQCALGTRNDGTEFSCSGSATNQFSNLLYVGAGEAPFPNNGGLVATDPQTNTFSPYDGATDTFNFNPYNHYQRPSERYTFGAFADYDITENVEFYTELMYMNNRTNSQIAPSGVFGYGVSGGAGGINCDNPFLSEQQRAYICTNAGLDDDDIAEDILVLRRNVEGGNRNQDIRHQTFRALGGLRGDIGDTPFRYNVYAMFAQVQRTETYNNDLSISKLTRALYAVEDENGNIVCNVNADDDPANDDAACAPYDVFSGAGPSDAALDYIVNPLNRNGTTEQQVVSATVSGSLDEYGIASPWAEEAVAVAVGAEYRRDFLDSNPDANYQSGDGAGQGGPTLPISGSLDVWDVFGEVNVPLIQGAPGVDQFGLDLAARHSTYNNFNATAYKVGGDYAPVPDIRFRASYQRAVRAPNIFELFAQQGIGLFDLSEGDNGNYDPCSGADPSASFEQCANTGVTQAQYGNIADNPAGQFNTLGGGNLDLDPEVADTYTAGVVIEPEAVPGLIFSVDYFDINVEDLVGTVPEALSLNQCLNTGNDFFCSLVNRGSGGTLWANQTGFITATNVNTGSLATKGVDFLGSYTRPIGEYDISFDFVGTYLDELTTQPLPTSGPDETYDCAGLYGGNCGSPNPEWRHKFSTTLVMPAGVSLTGTWRFYDEVNVSQSSDQPALTGSFASINETLDAQNYFDLSARYQLNESTNLRAGVNNITDEEPPLSTIVGTAPGNGNTYPQVYDAFGRYVFVGGTIDF